MTPWTAAIPARPEPEVPAAQRPDEWTGEPSSHILNSALCRMGRYGAMGCVGPRPGTPPSGSDSRLADGLVTGIFDPRRERCRSAGSTVGGRQVQERSITPCSAAPAVKHPGECTAPICAGWSGRGGAARGRSIQFGHQLRRLGASLGSDGPDGCDFDARPAGAGVHFLLSLGFNLNSGHIGA